MAEPHRVLENLTSPELVRWQEEGHRTAIIAFGSTEQGGAHLALGKHNAVIRYLAERFAEQVGGAVVFPVVPFAPTGDPVRRSGHMAWAGSISLRGGTFTALAEDLVISALASGFTTILLLADHGEGQSLLAQVAERMDSAVSAQGCHVWHLSALYSEISGGHAGFEDTAMLLAVDQERRWVRKQELKGAAGRAGVEGDPAAATALAGERLLSRRLSAALAQFQSLRRISASQ